MNKTLLVIHAYPGCEETLRRHWPYYKLAGCDLLGVGRVDGNVIWPEPIPFVNIGRNSYVNGDNLPSRLVQTFRECVANPEYAAYDDFCVIEYDSIFTRPLPPHPSRMLVTHLACHGSPGFKGHHCFHPYWHADRETAIKIAAYGAYMIDQGDIEQGFPDRFLGLLVERYHLPWGQGRIYSRNTLDQPEYITQAIEAIQTHDAHYVHGVKTAAQLNALKPYLLCTS